MLGGRGPVDRECAPGVKDAQWKRPHKKARAVVAIVDCNNRNCYPGSQ
jgi:hypothetical protein